MVYIETPRLILRDWKEEDFIPFAEMNGNPSVMEFFLHPLSGEESRNLFAWLMPRRIFRFLWSGLLLR